MAEGSSATCKDCHKPIKWTSRDGRWIPEDPRTGDRHRCKIDRTCEGHGCGKVFQGAPWMKLCPACYKTQGGGRKGGQEPARSSRPKEVLEGGPLDDDPF